MLDTIMMYTGYTIVGLILAIFIFAQIFEFDRTDDYSIYKVLGFGFVTLRSDRLIRNVRLIRKDDKFGKRINDEGDIRFFDAPKWFNKYIHNFGVKA